MKSALLNKKIISSFVLCLMFVCLTFAQTSNSKVKRNSPFAPNPKGRTQIAKNTNTENADSAPQKVVNIESAEDKAEPVSAKIESARVDSAPAEGNGEALAEPSKVEESKTSENSKSPVTVLPTEIYKVGIGDILYISLQNAPAKESTYFTVLKDGTIDYPLAGEMVSVAGLTTDEVRAVLQEKIKLYENPLVSVKVRENNSHIYTVLGMVEKPGEKTLQREAYPLLVVRAEAVIQPRADRAVIKRANSQAETVDLKDAKSEEVLIYPGDIVEFTTSENADSGNTKQFYYIGGEIVSGGQKDFYKGITLTQAILASGGLKKQSVKKVIVRRKSSDGLLTPTIYDLKSVKDGKAADPELQAGDTIEIGN